MPNKFIRSFDENEQPGETHDETCSRDECCHKCDANLDDVVVEDGQEPTLLSFADALAMKDLNRSQGPRTT